ncbi:MAG: carboxypeptidase M32 [Phycisphaerales bacterium]|nr:carboxypeptidase M32 [Phycisphaerales bacterium]
MGMTPGTLQSTTTSTSTITAYSALIQRAREAQLLGSTGHILSWDQETMMPPGGIDHRSQQMGLLARLHHQMLTDPAIAEAIAECESDRGFCEGDSIESANVRELRKDFDRATKLPPRLVSELAEVSGKGQHEWAGARSANDFARFRPWLERLVHLNREKAACLGVPQGGEPWDALAETFEPGCTAATVVKVFTPLRERLRVLIGELMSSSHKPSNRFNETKLPVDAQAQFVRMVVESIGFDFERGRLDTSTHPFCGGSHCDDVRMTTRYTESCLNDALGSSMHEAGHGMYEQGLLRSAIGTPVGEAVSLGIHESQSRLWENQVGRSNTFWKWCGPQLQRHFGACAAGFTHDEFYGAANVVEPGFIRVDADEATYNMHVMVRFELERLLMSGALDPKDLPGEWNRRYKEYLGVNVPDDRRGCLQDVHWSMGAFGYFPTYTLGTLYSAQFFDSATRAIGGLEAGFALGEFAPLRAWLNSQIHAHGRRYSPSALCLRVTGSELSSEPYLKYLEGKLRPLYSL